MDTAELYRLYSHLTVEQVLQMWLSRMLCGWPISLRIDGEPQRAILNGIEREDGSGYNYNLKVTVGEGKDVHTEAVFVAFPRSMALVR